MDGWRPSGISNSILVYFEASGVPSPPHEQPEQVAAALVMRAIDRACEAVPEPEPVPEPVPVPVPEPVPEPHELAVEGVRVLLTAPVPANAILALYGRLQGRMLPLHMTTRRGMRWSTPSSRRSYLQSQQAAL